MLYCFVRVFRLTLLSATHYVALLEASSYDLTHIGEVVLDLTNYCKKDIFFKPTKTYTGDDVPIDWYSTHGISIPIMICDMEKQNKACRETVKKK